MDSYNPRSFLKSGTPKVDGCLSAIVYVLFLFLFFYISFIYQPIPRISPLPYSLMCIIACSMSIVPHAGKILLEMLTVDSYWELDTI
jgi:hypothetical protein